MKLARTKKVFRSAAALAVLLLIVVGALVACKDPLARWMAERRIRRQTGLEATIGKLELGLGSGTLRVKDLKVLNSAAFGGSVLVDVPELYVELDARQAAAGKLHFRQVRLHLRELNVVRNREGRFNLEALPRPAETNSSPSATSKNGGSDYEFGGIDQLALTVDRLNYTDLKQPAASRRMDLSFHEEATNLQAQADVEQWAKACVVRLLVQEYFKNLPQSKRKGIKPLLEALTQ